jgi:hypothetical protein
MIGSQHHTYKRPPGASRDLFPNNILSRFISPESQKDWLTQLAVFGPLSKLDLTDQNRFDPVAAFHDRERNPQAPSASAFLRQVHRAAEPQPVASRQCQLSVGKRDVAEQPNSALAAAQALSRRDNGNKQFQIGMPPGKYQKILANCAIFDVSNSKITKAWVFSGGTLT